MERESGAAHHGTVEAGLSSGDASGGPVASGGCYFLLTRRGGDFVAQPVHGWHTFRPVNARSAHGISPHPQLLRHLVICCAVAPMPAGYRILLAWLSAYTACLEKCWLHSVCQPHPRCCSLLPLKC